LDVNDNTFITNHFFVHIATIPEHRANLRVIRAENSKTTVYLIPHLEELEALERIHLSTNFTKNLTLEHVRRLPSSLNKLDLSHNQIFPGDTQGSTLRSPLDRHLGPRLETLIWSQVPRFRCSDYQLPPTLTRLHLNRCENIDPEGFSLLGSSTPHLVELCIKHANNLTPDHLSLLPPSLTKLKLPIMLMHQFTGHNIHVLSRFPLIQLKLETLPGKISSAALILLPYTIRKLSWTGLEIIHADHIAYLPQDLEHLTLPSMLRMSDQIAASLPRRLKTLDLPKCPSVTPLSLQGHARLQHLTLGLQLQPQNISIPLMQVLPRSIRILQLPDFQDPPGKAETLTDQHFTHLKELEFLVIGPKFYYPRSSVVNDPTL
jgi:hypothetical protein